MNIPYSRGSTGSEGPPYLLVGDGLAYVLQVATDVLHIGVPQQDPGKVLLTDGGHALGEGEELYLQHLRLQVVHESGVGQRALVCVEGCVCVWSRPNQVRFSVLNVGFHGD